MAINRYLKDDPQIKVFKNDLTELMNNLKDYRVIDYSDYTAEVTHDPIDMLLSGTDIDGSCQHVSGDPDYTKCLLSFMLDGKNQAVVIKDPSGSICARAIIRI